MMVPGTGVPPLMSEEDVADLCGETVFRRAKRYYQNGYVLRPRLEGNTLAAAVQGSAVKPYQVAVSFEADDVIGECDCLYGDEYCKHVGALLIAWALEPELFTVVDGRVIRPGRSAAAATVPSRAGDSASGFGELVAEGPVEEITPAEELRRLFEGRTVQELRQVARRRDIPLRGTAKGEIVAQVTAGLLEPRRMRAAVGELSAADLVLLDLVHLLARTLFVSSRRIAEAVAALQISMPGEPEALLRDLHERGLLASGQRGSYEEDTYRLPEAVLAYLPPADYLVRRAKAHVMPAAAGSRLPADETLYLLWQHFRRHSVQQRPAEERSLLEKTNERLKGWRNVSSEVAQLQARANWQYQADLALTALPPEPEVADDDLDALAQLAGGDREVAELGFHLLRRLKLLSGKDRFTAQEDALRQFLRYAPEQRRRAIATAWLELAGWSELTLVLRHDGRLRMRRRVASYVVSKPSNVCEQLRMGRRSLLRFLQRLEEGVWYSLPALLEAMRRLAGDTVTDPFVWQGAAQAGWWLELGPAYRLDPREAEEWAVGYGRFFVEALRGPLTWLGVATVAEAGGEEAFRIDGLRALLAGEMAAGEAARPLEVNEDLTLTVPAGGDLQVHDFLLAIAEPGEATPRGVRYRITPRRVAQAFGAGRDVAEILAFLEEAAAGQVPRAVRATLEDWWARYGELHLYADLTLIEFADDYTLPELLAATSLRSRLIYQFSPRLVAVDAAAADSLVEELVRKGYTPKVAEEAG